MQTPEWIPLQHFRDYPFWARLIAFLATSIIAAVVLIEWIVSLKLTGYCLVLGSVEALFLLILFVRPNPNPILIHNEITGENNVPDKEVQPKKAETEVQETKLQHEKKKQESLQNLTREEKQFLAPYIFQDLTSQYVDVMSGIYQSLHNKQIVGTFAPVGYLTWFMST